MKNNKNLCGESFNFGPIQQKNYTVLDVVKEISKRWNDVKFKIESDKNQLFHESNLLKLNCDKALEKLNWKPILNFQETIEFTSEWYKQYYVDYKKISNLTEKQIKIYQELFIKRNNF